MARKPKKQEVTIDAEATNPTETGEQSSVSVEVENVDAEDGNVEIIGKKQEYSLTMYLNSDTDPKVFVRFIKKVERLVRGNPDYKDYIENLRNEEGLDRCAILGKVDVNKAEIHLHHCISNLYTICITVCNRLMAEGKKVSSFILADEVISLHLANKIALVPLTATMHELAHSGKVKIPKSVIYGNYQEYYEQHKAYMDEIELALYEEIEGLEYLGKSDVLKITNQTDEEEDE